MSTKCHLFLHFLPSQDERLQYTTFFTEIFEVCPPHERNSMPLERTAVDYKLTLVLNFKMTLAFSCRLCYSYNDLECRKNANESVKRNEEKRKCGV